MPDETPLNWWQTLYDDIVADLLLVRKDRAELDATISFLIRQLGLAPGAVVFDQCCGIGSLSLPLARAGYPVIGVDQCGAYIDQALEVARIERLDAQFHAADAFLFHPDRACDASFNWGTSFGNADDASSLQMLQRAFQSLRPGGRFLLDYQNISRLLSRFERVLLYRQPDATGETLLLRESTLDLPGGTIRQVWTFIKPDGRHLVRHSAVRLYLPHELAAMLRATGFRDITFHGGVHEEPLSPDSPRCILVARRPGP